MNNPSFANPFGPTASVSANILTSQQSAKRVGSQSLSQLQQRLNSSSNVNYPSCAGKRNAGSKKQLKHPNQNNVGRNRSGIQHHSHTHTHSHRHNHRHNEQLAAAATCNTPPFSHLQTTLDMHAMLQNLITPQAAAAAATCDSQQQQQPQLQLQPQQLQLQPQQQSTASKDADQILLHSLLNNFNSGTGTGTGTGVHNSHSHSRHHHHPTAIQDLSDLLHTQQQQPPPQQFQLPAQLQPQLKNMLSQLQIPSFPHALLSATNHPHFANIGMNRNTNTSNPPNLRHAQLQSLQAVNPTVPTQAQLPPPPQPPSTIRWQNIDIAAIAQQIPVMSIQQQQKDTLLPSQPPPLLPDHDPLRQLSVRFNHPLLVAPSSSSVVDTLASHITPPCSMNAHHRYQTHAPLTLSTLTALSTLDILSGQKRDAHITSYSSAPKVDEACVAADSSDSDSVLSSSSSSVDQFLGKINHSSFSKSNVNDGDDDDESNGNVHVIKKKRTANRRRSRARRKPSSDSRPIAGEPPAKKRKLFHSEQHAVGVNHLHSSWLNNVNLPSSHFNGGPDLLVEDVSAPAWLQSALSQRRRRAAKFFSREQMVQPPFIFKLDAMDLYPHALCKQLLKYGWDESNQRKRNLTASQLLKVYGENRAQISTYQEYIHLPSVLPITLPVLDGATLSVDCIREQSLLKHAFLVRNWQACGAKFPLHCSYMDLLLSIGGETRIRLIDNITNAECEEGKHQLSLAQYLRVLSKEAPEQRTFSMNLISLEATGSVLDCHIVRAAFVRQLDWISPLRRVWLKHKRFRKYFYSTTNNLRGIIEAENADLFRVEDGVQCHDDDGDGVDDELDALKTQYLLSDVKGSYFPEIQKYVLISSANSFTQWHTDFNGSAVWYYMVEGFKYFYLIYADQKILEKYRKWHSENKRDIWFPEFAKCETQLVVVRKNEMVLIPPGCIHCVYTPVDAIAFGGNFLCDENMEMQLKIEHLYHQIYTPHNVACMHYFRDVCAMRFIEYYHHLHLLYQAQLDAAATETATTTTTTKNRKRRRASSKKQETAQQQQQPVSKNVSALYFKGKHADRDKQQAIDLGIQMLFWLKEEQYQQTGNAGHCHTSGNVRKSRERKKSRDRKDERLCKFELIDVQKMAGLIHDTLEMLGVDCKNERNKKYGLQNEMKKFLKKYPMYKPPKNGNANASQLKDEEDEKDDGEGERQDDDEDYNVGDDDDDESASDDDDDEEESVSKRTVKKKMKNNRKSKRRPKRQDDEDDDDEDDDEDLMISEEEDDDDDVQRTKSNRKKKKNTAKNSKPKKNKSKQEQQQQSVINQCSKCQEKGSTQHMVRFVCCNSYYHLRCAGFTTVRTQQAIQKYIENGSINKLCPQCAKNGTARN